MSKVGGIRAWRTTGVAFAIALASAFGVPVGAIGGAVTERQVLSAIAQRREPLLAAADAFATECQPDVGCSAAGPDVVSSFGFEAERLEAQLRRLNKGKGPHKVRRIPKELRDLYGETMIVATFVAESAETWSDCLTSRRAGADPNVGCYPELEQLGFAYSELLNAMAGWDVYLEDLGG